MAPIRIGLIGLNANIKPGSFGGQWGIIHLAALKASPHYQLVAICNSSVESAKRAIATHELGEHIRAYGSPEDIAADPEVDMIAVSVHVDRHYELAKPAILAGKNVFIEYPLASNMEQMEELQRLAHEKGVKVVVGAQAVADPVHQKIKQILRDGTIGDVVSSNFDTVLPIVTADGWSDALAVWLKMDFCGNRFTIGMGHSKHSLSRSLFNALPL
jgi:predicted dehydrogenase